MGVFVTRVDLQKLRGFGLSVFSLFLFACFADANQKISVYLNDRKKPN